MQARNETATLVFYDGVCGLCDRFVRFLLARDRHKLLLFAPLQGMIAGRELPARGYDPRDLDTVIVLAGWRSADQRLLARSRAVLHAVAQLGGWWRLLATVAAVVPPPIADALYTAIARRRYRLFGRYDVCPMPRPEWQSRFVEQLNDGRTHAHR